MVDDINHPVPYRSLVFGGAEWVAQDEGTKPEPSGTPGSPRTGRPGK